MNTIVTPAEPVKKPKKTPKTPKSPKPKFNYWLWIKRLFLLGGVTGICVLIFVVVYTLRVTKDLPSVDSLKEYSPAVMSRVHAGDGKLIAEYGIEKRVFVPINTIPKQIQHALVASEDQRFYTHNGFDLKGFTRAMLSNVKHVLKNERFEGGSTLTQQVAKHFLVGNERKIDRKIREVFIARRIEKAMSKDKILELYLNDVYFGRRAYGIAGASLNYFNKPLDGLSLGQKAYLAGLVKGPNNYQPNKNMQKALNRRNYVLTRMELDGYITLSDAAAAKKETLEIVPRLFGDEYLAAEYFVSAVRKKINKMYGEKQLNEGGLSIRTTLDTKMQLAARMALRRGLGLYDRRHGYRGTLGALQIDGVEGDFDPSSEWKPALKSFAIARDLAPWRKAVVLSVTDKKAVLGFVDGEDGTLALSDMKWAGKALPDGRVGDEPKTLLSIFLAGEVILVERDARSANRYHLRQVPKANGGIIAMDPHTGRVLALVGGYSFAQSQFNRVTQAYRQPGSSFKPFVYAAALDNGFTPASRVLDAPFVIEHNDRDESCDDQTGQDLASVRFGRADEDGQSAEQIAAQRLAEEAAKEILIDPLTGLPFEEKEKECGPRFYKPANFNAGKFYGLSTLRLGLEKSRNAMTVRLANDIGMTSIGQYGRNFGIYDETKPELAWALGAGETTLLRMASAYATLVNGGKKVTPTLLDRVQDNSGKTVFLHDDRTCPECKIAIWDETSIPTIDGFDDIVTRPQPPVIPDERETVISPVTAYQITSMLEGAVQRGTGRQMLRLERPLAGKTGTTNDYKDAWFMGFSPDLVTGVYVGMDQPASLGTETGAKAAGPIWRFFMGDVLKDKPKVSFRIPQGVTLAPVDQITGEPSFIGATGFIYEAFLPGTEPQLGARRSKISIGGNSNADDDDYDFGFDGAGATNFGGDDKVEQNGSNTSREIYDFEELSSENFDFEAPKVVTPKEGSEDGSKKQINNKTEQKDKKPLASKGASKAMNMAKPSDEAEQDNQSNADDDKPKEAKKTVSKEAESLMSDARPTDGDEEASDKKLTIEPKDETVTLDSDVKQEMKSEATSNQDAPKNVDVNILDEPAQTDEKLTIPTKNMPKQPNALPSDQMGNAPVDEADVFEDEVDLDNGLY